MKIFKWHVLKNVDLYNIEAEGFKSGYMNRDETVKSELIHARREAYQKGRDFEFKTINTHMQGMFTGKMTENVEWVVQRFRETMKSE